MHAKAARYLTPAPALVLGLTLLAAPFDALGWSSAPMQVNTLDRNDVGALFNGYYQSARIVRHGWTGSADGCVPGDTSVEFKQAQIGQINWNRAMAGVPAQVQFDNAHLSGEQQLGVMLAVNRMLSHAPPTSWLCYTAAAAEAAGASNITLSLRSGPDDGALPSPGFVSGFMQDGGANNVDVGHRRWLVHPPTTQMTIGMGQARGTDGFLATGGGIRVIYPSSNDPWPQTRWGYVAWPAPGFVPWQEAPGRWSIIVEKADFSAATVRVSYGTAIVPTRIISASGPLGPFFGGPALVWEFTRAAGATFDPLAPAANFVFLKPDRDTTYVVHVDNVNVQGQGMRSFEYTVVVFDPATHEVDFNVLFENGWWWNAAQSGRGFFIEKQGNVLFIAAYLYADDGRARWLAALCTLDSATSCSGPLSEYFGGQTLGGAYKPPMSPTNVGQMRLTFPSRTSATLEWPGGTLALERLVFGANRFDGTTTGWWWYDVESGTGWGFEIQGTTFVIVGYFYDDDGRPVWYLGAGTVTGGNVLSGRLERYSGGQTLAGPYRPPNPPIDAGAFTLQLTSPNTANLLAGGRQIKLQRFLFGR